MKKINTKIKVVGIGGAGCNAVSRMAKSEIKGVQLIAINTDDQDLKKIKADIKLKIGRQMTQGLGAGMNPEVGKMAAEEQKEEIKEVLKNSDLIFITCGQGGGTGSGASPVVAEIAKNLGALTIGIVTQPFSFEGLLRKEIAQEGIKNLKEKIDTLIVISNDNLFSALAPDISLLNAFWFCDETLRQAVQGISDLIVLPGIINIDFADIKTILKDSGTAFFGIGQAKGEKRAEEAAKKAIYSPLFNVSPKGAKGILFNVSGGKDLTLTEVEEIAGIFTKEIIPKDKVIFGAVEDKKLTKGEIKVTVIATGF